MQNIKTVERALKDTQEKSFPYILLGFGYVPVHKFYTSITQVTREYTHTHTHLLKYQVHFVNQENKNKI